MFGFCGERSLAFMCMFPDQKEPVRSEMECPLRTTVVLVSSGIAGAWCAYHLMKGGIPAILLTYGDIDRGGQQRTETKITIPRRLPQENSGSPVKTRPMKSCK